jgi:hypothetical protein
MHGRSLLKRHLSKKKELRHLISRIDVAFGGDTESMHGFATD